MNRAVFVLLAVALGLAPMGASAQTIDYSSPSLVRVRYVVDNVQASVDFYTKHLGFKLDAQTGPYFAALSRGGVQLLISPTKGPGGASQPMPNGDRPAPGGWNRMVLNTVDVRAEAEKLRNLGVHFRNDVVVGLGGDQVLIEDPSGNVIELFQPTAVYTSR
jgi:catechol 2,3-dioxygenase-like lactoylglutathione lyase family enzyme